MKKLTALKEKLGKNYCFSRPLSNRDIYLLTRTSSPTFNEITVASLTVGTVKIHATLFKTDEKFALCYDVFVKDIPDSIEWIHYDTPSERVKLDESEMFSVLDRVVSENHLSYTKCCFDNLNGKTILQKKKLEDKPT